jgi:hypothetical protein
MAYITIKTDTDEGFIMFQERISPGHVASEVYRAHLVERLRWAVEDADVTAPQPGSTGATAID